MDNVFDDTRRAVAAAKDTLAAADICANNMAQVLRGRLCKVDHWTLVTLKKELARYDMRKRVWK